MSTSILKSNPIVATTATTTTNAVAVETKKQKRKTKPSKKETTVTDTAHKIVSKYLKRRRKIVIAEMNYGQSDTREPNVISKGSLNRCINCNQEYDDQQTSTFQIHFGYRKCIAVCAQCALLFQR
jgi:hypothetical protein